jgi:hypothetical protein
MGLNLFPYICISEELATKMKYFPGQQDRSWELVISCGLLYTNFSKEFHLQQRQLSNF